MERVEDFLLVECPCGWVEPAGVNGWASALGIWTDASAYHGDSKTPQVGSRAGVLTERLQPGPPPPSPYLVSAPATPGAAPTCSGSKPLGRDRA